MPPLKKCSTVSSHKAPEPGAKLEYHAIPVAAAYTAVISRAVEISGGVARHTVDHRTSTSIVPAAADYLEYMQDRFAPSTSGLRRKLEDNSASAAVARAEFTSRGGRSIQIAGPVEHQLPLWVSAIRAVECEDYAVKPPSRAVGLQFKHHPTAFYFSARAVPAARSRAVEISPSVKGQGSLGIPAIGTVAKGVQHSLIPPTAGLWSEFKHYTAFNAPFKRRAVDVASCVQRHTIVWRRSIRSARESIEHGLGPSAAHSRGQLEDHSTPMNAARARGAVKVPRRV